jgi:hypothetical protein
MRPSRVAAVQILAGVTVAIATAVAPAATADNAKHPITTFHGPFHGPARTAPAHTAPARPKAPSSTPAARTAPPQRGSYAPMRRPVGIPANEVPFAPSA